MNIATLIDGLPMELVCGSLQTEISCIAEDSRLAEPGCLFIARQGTQTDGAQYITDAIANGAVAVVATDEAIVPADIAKIITDDPNQITASLAERFYASPSKSLQLIGVTGTNGKTTTAHLIHQLLNQANMRCGLVGTVQIDNGQNLVTASLTTPSSIDLNKLLRAMVDNGCKAAVVEVSSHALDQGRVRGLAFDLAVFTNLSGDHLDYHNSMDAYANAKSQLFEMLPADAAAIINIDDPNAENMVRNCKARILRCTTKDISADFSARCLNASIDGMDARFSGLWGEFEVCLPLVGLYNLSNALQAASVANVMGLNKNEIQQGLSICAAPPGRLEQVKSQQSELTVLVDYAHTDDALTNVLKALKPLVPEGNKVILVFGCGGDRDKTKRPRMAQAALAFADQLIITSDNPRTEDPQTIIDEIMEGVPKDARGKVFSIVDRRQAIEAAIEQVRPGDVVLIAGKGHEPYQIIGTQRIDFDDRIIAAEIINEHLAKVGML